MNQTPRKTQYLLIAFIISALVQLAVPAWQIVQAERALDTGAVWRFEVYSYDPYDIMRGRYLRFDVPGLTLDKVAEWRLRGFQSGDVLCGLLERDNLGFGYIRSVVPWERRPRHEAWIRLEYLGDGQVAAPFDRYYINQAAAPEIEERFRNFGGTAWIEVRLEAGYGVLERFMIGGQALR
jgi:hypothetical protein